MKYSEIGLSWRGRMIAIGVFFFMCGAISLAQSYDYNSLMERIKVDQRSGGLTDNGTMDSWVTSQNANGSWADLTYGNLSSSVTTKNNHLFRLWNLAAVVTKVGHAKYNDAAYKEAIKTGLSYWYGSNTVDPNWWFNKIYFPQKLGEVLIFMREFTDFIPTVSSTGIDEPELLSMFIPTSIIDITSHGTGANAIDIARHYVYRGILTANSNLLENTRNQVELILLENIEADLVYQDHGPQIQISSYGWVFCDGLVKLASYLADSPAAFDTNSTSFSQVLQFIRETQVSSIRGRSWDFGVMGRAVSRANALNANLNYLQKLADFIDPANSTEYLNALSRIKGNSPANTNVRVFNKHYWASDYSQHARTGYLFTVRNTSTRTVEAESGNGENLKANYLSYGANFLSIDGDEYTNIMPVWDWAMIPGTTFPHITTFPARTNWGFNFGSTSFVGGVSDGVHGAAVLELDEAGIQAKKSWFFFEDEIVCLGAGITDNSNRNVRTTVNQCWMETPSYICETGSVAETMKSVSSSTYANTKLKYIRHGKFGYFFPEQGDVKYTMKSQSGTWKSINTNGSTENQSGYVFSLWVDHGINPSNSGYSYIVAPGIDTQQKAQAYDLSAIEIVENSTVTQAVYQKTLDILQVIFHQAGTLVHGTTSITVNKPCALMFKNGTLVTVSDPTQVNSVIVVSIDVDGIEYNKIISLPTLNERNGASVTVDFQINIPSSVKDFEKMVDLTYFPNPTKGVLHMLSEEDFQLMYQVKDLNGSVVRNGQFLKETTIDLSGCASGIYIISLIGHKGETTKKIIKY